MDDQWGNAIVAAGGGSAPWVFTREADGLVVSFPGTMDSAAAQAAAVRAFNGMAPSGTVLPATPDPFGFGTAVFQDQGITLAVRMTLMPWIAILAQQLGNPELIAAGWDDLVAGVPIGSSDHSLIAAHATAYAIPGIT